MQIDIISLYRVLSWVRAACTALLFLLFVQSAIAQQGEMSIAKADELGGEAYNLYLEGKYHVAIAVYERILPVLEQHEEALRTWTFHALDYSLCFIRLGQDKKALQILNKISRRNNGTFEPWLGGWYFNYKAQAVENTGDLNQAFELYEQAISFMEETDDLGALSTILNNYSNVLKHNGSFTRALETIKESIRVLQKKDEVVDRVLAIRYNNLALIYQQLSMYDTARHYFNKSLEIRQKIGAPMFLATIHNNLGNLAVDEGNLEDALVHHQKNIEYRKKANNPIKLANTYLNVANLYLKIRDSEKARYYFSQSHDILSGYDNKQALAKTYSGLSSLSNINGDVEAGLNYLLMALDIYENLDMKLKQYEMRMALSNLYTDSGDFEKAVEMANAATNLARIIDSDHYTVRALVQKGDINAKLNKFEEAATYYKRASENAGYLPTSQKIPALTGLAESYNQLGKKESFDIAYEAIDYMEQYRDRAGYTSDIRASVFSDFVPFYKKVASWHIQSNYKTEMALKLIEAAKARAFSDDLARAASDFEEKLPDSLNVVRQEYLFKLQNLYAQIDTTQAARHRENIRDDILETETAYEAFLNTLDQNSLYQLQFSNSRSFNLEQSQQKTPDNTTFLQYAVLDTSIIITAFNNQHYRAKIVPFSDSNIKDRAHFNEQIATYIDLINAKTNIDELKQAAQLLSDILIKPVSSFIKSHDNLIIVPDGTLAYLPFETMQFNGNYLIYNNAIKYLPSISSQQFLSSGSDSHPKELLVMAGAEFGGDLTYEPRRQSQLAALPYTIAEVDSIAGLFNGQKTVWKYQDVSEGKFKNEPLNQYKYIHLATHGIINEEDQEFSGLVLDNRNIENNIIGDDGFLRVSEIFQLKMNAEMVVLSACNTARGKLVEGEGIMGLQRAFLTAGASSLVVSLWSVYDRSTALLMPEFYRNIRKEASGFDIWFDSFLRWIGWDDSRPFGNKAPAMQKAKLKMLEHPVFNHPVYWAPFIVIG